MNVPAGPSRLGAARRRAGLAKRTFAVSSAAAFAVALVLARTSHPAASQAGSTTSGATAVATDDDGFDFDSGSIAPSGGSAPTVQSNGS